MICVFLGSIVKMKWRHVRLKKLIVLKYKVGRTKVIIFRLYFSPAIDYSYTMCDL